MNKFLQYVHDNQIVVAAIILFFAVLVYCMYHRYDAATNNGHAVIVDHLRGRYLTIYGDVPLKPRGPAIL